MSIKELEAAVTELSKEELTTFTQWLEEYVAAEWDRQIEADARAGRLDKMITRAKTDYHAGKATAFP